MRFFPFLAAAAMLAVAACSTTKPALPPEKIEPPPPLPAVEKPVRAVAKTVSKPAAPKPAVTKTDEEWRRILTPEQYRIMRQKGTEASFTGAYWNHHETGQYRCAGCGAMLFASDHKYDTSCGWPSFFKPVANVGRRPDTSDGMRRTEVYCSKCGAHLGHVFTDGPLPTGLRYCINSASLKFAPKSGATVPAASKP